jgi:hypothetical protein
MPPGSVELLRRAYAPLIDLAAGVDEATGWTPTGLPGWTVRDLLFHLAGDCQRALVAMATPSDLPVDTDEVSYWTPWRPGTDSAQAGLRGIRIIASAWSSVRGPADLHVETARAVLHVAAHADLDVVVTTQQRVLTIDSLLRTLAVEAAIHHVDLGAVLPSPPHTDVLAEVRRVLDALLGAPTPDDWDTVRWIRVATGRVEPSSVERAALGTGADKLPLFG